MEAFWATGLALPWLLQVPPIFEAPARLTSAKNRASVTEELPQQRMPILRCDGIVSLQRSIVRAQLAKWHYDLALFGVPGPLQAPGVAMLGLNCNDNGADMAATTNQEQ